MILKGVSFVSESFLSVLEIIKNGTYGFESIYAFILELCRAAFTNEHIVTMNAWFTGILAPVLTYVPYVFIAFWAVVWLFGKRLSDFFCFLAFFLTGFVLGIYYLSAPVAVHFPEIPGWAVGLAVGIALGLLQKVLFYLVYSVTVGYGAYLACVSGIILPEIKGNYIVGLIVAAVSLVLFLVIHNWVERFGSAFLGAYFMLYIVVHCVYDFTALVLGYAPFIPAGFEWTVLVGSAFILAIPGFIVQQKMKKTKY